MISIFDIHKKLGLNDENGLFVKKTVPSSKESIEDLYDGNFTEYKFDFKIEYALKKLQPHSFFLFNSEPIILFFDCIDSNPNERRELSEKIWNFNKAALAFVNYSKELIIYNGFQFDKKTNLLKTLETIKDVKELSEIKENYSYWKIVTAELWNTNDDEFRSKHRVDTKLLENIKTARKLLLDNKLSEKHSNRIIARLILVRYLIDRSVNFDYEGKELLTKGGLPKLILQKDNLFDFFEYLLNKFNGALLPLNGERNAINSHHLQILSDLFAGNNIKTRQKSLFNVFNFDFIPIELISNIYETFLGEKQDKDKAFYTPPFLVDYILDQTVKPFVENQTDPEKLSCKTIDFTCGSGIFLCETLRTIINRYIKLTRPDKSSIDFKNKIKQFLVDNIYGNDINNEALEIAKFSLFITLLDYFEDPKDIEKFKFPDVSKNFFNNDVFDTELNSEFVFSSKLDDTFGKNKYKEPDFIIGNPPWGKIQTSLYIKYCENREKKEDYEFKQKKEINVSNKEFAQAFLLRLSDFSTENTVCHIIVSSKILYNLQADKFRNYFLNNFLIDEVLEISSVRQQIFSNAVGPAAIIKYRYAFGKDTNENVIDYVSLKPNPYFSIFKSILIEKYDYKEVIQKELIKNDWLWKVLVYGHILDYRFIERLRDINYFPITLGGLIEDKEDSPLFARTGIMIGNKSKDISKYCGMLYIDTNSQNTGRDSDLQRYYIYFKRENVWKSKKAEGNRSEKVFNNPPMLLIKQGFTPDFNVVASISYISAIFTRSIYSISANNSDNQKIIENIFGIVCSSLMNYHIVITCLSSINERDRLVNAELNDFPIVFDDNIALKAKNLIILKRLIKIHQNSSFPDYIKIEKYEKQFLEKESELNEMVFQLYQLTDTERDLISYAQEITIPILQAKNKSFKEIKLDKRLVKPYNEVNEQEITEYINIYKEHFNKLHPGGDRGYFNVRIIQSDNILACEFYIKNEKFDDEWEPKNDNTKALELLASFGFQKVSNRLFIQKDVKILQKDSFIVVKPNQYKYWHKAIARFDVIEFMEAMIQSQNRIPNENK